LTLPDPNRQDDSVIDLRHLTLWQRFRRRIALLGGSYTHPDGFIELDFEGPAEIDGRNDSDKLQETKLDNYHRRRSAVNTRYFWFILGFLCGAILIRSWSWL
jgi:hypothetical protein